MVPTAHQEQFVQYLVQGHFHMLGFEPATYPITSRPALPSELTIHPKLCSVKTLYFIELGVKIFEIDVKEGIGKLIILSCHLIQSFVEEHRCPEHRRNTRRGKHGTSLGIPKEIW